ncbi:MAG TPA: deoxyribodipyrimidine photo-lyase [Clostridia bacterium]|nr:deoxyribodipyrimidine photo-lyase [Clostridia bacterium]
MGRKPCLVWLRQDLRTADNPALAAASARGGKVIPIYVWAPEEEGDWPPGGAAKWWLHESLQKLDQELRGLGSRLIVRRGPSLATLRGVVRESGAEAVFWNRRFEPEIRKRDEAIEHVLAAEGVEVLTFNGAVLNEPWTIRNKAGKPFQVFTAYWRHCAAQGEPRQAEDAPRRVLGPRQWPVSLPVAELGLEPKPDWAGGLRAAWRPGSIGARARLDEFLTDAFERYAVSRDMPGLEGTSRLSPHLHWGEISPHQVWHALRARAERGAMERGDWRESRFATELGWREFSHYLLFHFPHTEQAPLRAEFARFRWRNRPEQLQAWQRGRTGFPMVDAGMRELWSTGWMHNRVRMIAGSFLVKDLLINWLEGARWFWDTLVDADLAQNTLGWQWTAGCGADAAPFFRIFNPITQGEKFDAKGDYIRKWIPELAGLPDKWIHQPRLAPPEVLRKAGVELGVTYPEPIINHVIAREVALEAFAKLKTESALR